MCGREFVQWWPEAVDIAPVICMACTYVLDEEMDGTTP